MTDLLHTHLAFGFHKDCAACAQVEAVFERVLVPQLVLTLLTPQIRKSVGTATVAMDADSPVWNAVSRR